MLDAAIKNQLQVYPGKLQQPIELIASPDDSPKALEMCELLEATAALGAFDHLIRQSAQ